MGADVVIIATGFQPDPLEWLAAHGITLEANGRIQVMQCADPQAAHEFINIGSLPSQQPEGVRRWR